MLLNRLILIFLCFLFNDCSPTFNPSQLKTQAHLYSAYEAWVAGQNSQSLIAIQAAMASSLREPVSDSVLVEVYDDAGLYYHLAQRHTESVRFQSIAVLLSRKLQVSEFMKTFYQANLSLAFSGAEIPVNSVEKDFATPTLLAISGVRDNPHIQRVYGISPRVMARDGLFIKPRGNRPLLTN
jgi:hypothetical protein